MDPRYYPAAPTIFKSEHHARFPVEQFETKQPRNRFETDPRFSKPIGASNTFSAKTILTSRLSSEDHFPEEDKAYGRLGATMLTTRGRLSSSHTLTTSRGTKPHLHSTSPVGLRDLHSTSPVGLRDPTTSRGTKAPVGLKTSSRASKSPAGHKKATLPVRLDLLGFSRGTKVDDHLSSPVGLSDLH